MSDELNPDVRKLVDLARQARTPSVSDQRRVAERLAVPLAAGVAVGTAAKAVGAQSLFGALGAKVAAVVAVAVAVTAAVVAQRAPTTARAPTPAVTAPATLTPVAAPVEAPSVAPPPSTRAEPPAPTRPSPPAPARSFGSARELEEEATLLHRAQSAWRAGQSQQALDLANQHARRFPRSQLANERDVLRVLSLCKLGQVQSAKQVGARLLRSAQGSPWYQSVAASCAAE